MICTWLAVGLLAFTSQATAPVDVSTLPDLLDSLQPRLRDFRCEYEGTETLHDPYWQAERKLGPDGLNESFSGVYVWTNQGKAFFDAFHRMRPANNIVSERMVVRGDEVEHYTRLVDLPLGEGFVDDAIVTNPDNKGSVGSIQLIDSIKRTYRAPYLKKTVEATTLDNRPCVLLTSRWDETNNLYQQYWIDLKRGGQVLRCETYLAENRLHVRGDIELARFEVGGEPIWMPVAGSFACYANSDAKNKMVFHENPVSIRKIYIVQGSLAFNQDPPATTFTAKYKPGTPISNQLKQSRSEFGQQKHKVVSKAEAEAQLREQLKEAEVQRKELTASSPARGMNWAPWFLGVFAASALFASVLVLIARRR